MTHYMIYLERPFGTRSYGPFRDRAEAERCITALASKADKDSQGSIQLKEFEEDDDEQMEEAR